MVGALSPDSRSENYALTSLDEPTDRRHSTPECMNPIVGFRLVWSEKHLVLISIGDFIVPAQLLKSRCGHGQSATYLRMAPPLS